MTDRDTLTDHDLLIRIDERVASVNVWISESKAAHDEIWKWIRKHDGSHGRTMKVLGGIAAALGAIGGAVVAFLKN